MLNRFAILLLLTTLAACNDSSHNSPPVQPVQTTQAAPFSEWDITYSPGMPAKMTQQLDGTFTVDIPTAPGSIHYVTTPAPVVPLGATITVKFAIVGTGTVIPVPTADTPPATMRLFLQRKGDTMGGQGEYEFYRWWARATVVITAPGEYTLTAPVDPAQWTSVYGRAGNDPLAGNLFAVALSNLAVVGETFGGASFAGHGDEATGGPITFVLRSFTVQ